MSPDQLPVTDLLAQRRVPPPGDEFWGHVEASLSDEQPSTAESRREADPIERGRTDGSSTPHSGAPELELYTTVAEPTTPRTGAGPFGHKLWVAACAAAVIVLAIGVIGFRDDNLTPVGRASSSTGSSASSDPSAPSSDEGPLDTSSASPSEVVAVPFDVSLLLDPFDPAAESSNAESLRWTVERLPWNSRDDAHLDPIAAVDDYLDFIDETFSGTFDATVVGQRASSAPTLQEVEVALPQYEEPPFETPTITVFVYQSSIDATWWAVGSESSMITVVSPTPGQITSATEFTIEREHTGIGDLIEWVVLPHDSASVYRFDWTQTERLMGPNNSASIGGRTLTMWCGQVCSVLGQPGTQGTAIVITPRAATTVPITFSGR